MYDRPINITYLGDFDGTEITRFREENWNFSVQLTDPLQGYAPITSVDTIYINFPTAGSSGVLFVLTHISN